MMSPLSDRQTAEIELRVRERSGLRMAVDVTPAGLASIALLVSAILLSTRALVATTIKESRRHRGERK
jgi:hypothetical protein